MGRTIYSFVSIFHWMVRSKLIRRSSTFCALNVLNGASNSNSGPYKFAWTKKKRNIEVKNNCTTKTEINNQTIFAIARISSRKKEIITTIKMWYAPGHLIDMVWWTMEIEWPNKTALQTIEQLTIWSFVRVTIFYVENECEKQTKEKQQNIYKLVHMYAST